MFGFDPINAKIAREEQSRLVATIAELKNNLVLLAEGSKALFELRVETAAGVIHRVDKLVSQFSHRPQEYPKVIKQFWDAEKQLQAYEQLLRHASHEALEINEESLASTLGLSQVVVRSAFLSSAMATSLGSVGLGTVVGLLARPAAAYGISTAASAQLAVLLGFGLGARVALAPALVIPGLGEVIALGIAIWSAWELHDKAKKNVATAQRAANARVKVCVALEKVRTQNQHLRALQRATSDLVDGIQGHLDWFSAQGVLERDYRNLSREAMDRLVSISNSVMALSEILNKTTDDTLPEAEAEARRKAA